MAARFASWMWLAVALWFSGCNGSTGSGAASNAPSPVAIEAEYRLREGARLLGENKAAAAAEHLRRAVSLEPRNAQTRAQLCSALSLAGDHQGAMHQCQRAVALNPSDIGLLYSLADTHLKAGRSKEAKDVLARALEAAPNDPRSHELLAGIQLQEGKVAAAIGSLKEALRLNPQNGAALARLALALATTGKCDDAEQAMQRAQSLGQGSPTLSKSVRACGHMVFGTANGKGFLIDRRAVSGLEYSACVDKGVCPHVPYGKYNRQPDYKNEPAMSINHRAATTYCKDVGKRLPTVAEYQAVWKQLKWQGCCARGVIPREWTDTPGNGQGRRILARGTGKELETRNGVMKTGYDSNTVRCALDAPK